MKKTELNSGIIFNDWSRMFYNIVLLYGISTSFGNESEAKTRASSSKLVGVYILPYLSVPYCGGGNVCLKLLQIYFLAKY